MKLLKHDIVPKQIDIEVTSRCNLRCKLCPTLDGTAKAVDMPFSLFESIVNRITFPCSVVPWLNGEPTLHPRYADMLYLLNEKKLRYYVTTNAMIWREDVMFEIFGPHSTCYQVIFSLDGLDQRTASAARPGTDYDTVKHNIIRALDVRKAQHSKTDIAVKICERGQDYAEVEEFINQWISTANYVCVGKPLERTDNVNMRRYACKYSDPTFMVIKSDGRMTRCAYNCEATNDERFTMGRVDGEFIDTPLLDIYNNEEMTTFRNAQRNGVFPGPCATCGFAYTGDGLVGKLRFRSANKDFYELYYHEDYYNRFFSLVDKKKGGSWSPTFIRCRKCHSIIEQTNADCPSCGGELY